MLPHEEQMGRFLPARTANMAALPWPNFAPPFSPPVVAYSPAEQMRVAEEVAALPEGTLIAGWLADYAVLREQTRACR